MGVLEDVLVHVLVLVREVASLRVPVHVRTVVLAVSIHVPIHAKTVAQGHADIRVLVNYL